MEERTIGNLLRFCRERRNLTQRQLAEKLHLDRTTVTKIENGDILYPSYTLVKQWAAETDSTDIIGLDFCSTEAWKKLDQFETTLKNIKAAMELVNFMKVRGG